MRWEAHAMATEAVLNSYSSILGEDDTQKWDARKVAESIANKKVWAVICFHAKFLDRNFAELS